MLVYLSKWTFLVLQLLCFNQVATDITRLYINGEIMEEMCALCTFESLNNISLFGANEDDSVKGYVHGVEILPIMSSIKDHFVKVNLCYFHSFNFQVTFMLFVFIVIVVVVLCC